MEGATTTTTGWSIQERIRAMNAALDTVEQRQHQQQQGPTPPRSSSDNDITAATTTSTMMHSNDDDIDTDSSTKRSSVVDIWRTRESQNNNKNNTAAGSTKSKEQPMETTAATTTTVETETLSPPLIDPSRILDTYVTSKKGMNRATTAASLVIHTAARRTLVEEEEKKDNHEDDEVKNYDLDDDDDDENQFCTTPVGPVGPIRTVASASPSPPLLPGSNRKQMMFQQQSMMMTTTTTEVVVTPAAPAATMVGTASIESNDSNDNNKNKTNDDDQRTLLLQKEQQTRADIAYPMGVPSTSLLTAVTLAAPTKIDQKVIQEECITTSLIHHHDATHDDDRLPIQQRNQKHHSIDIDSVTTTPTRNDQQQDPTSPLQPQQDQHNNNKANELSSLVENLAPTKTNDIKDSLDADDKMETFSNLLSNTFPSNRKQCSYKSADIQSDPGTNTPQYPLRRPHDQNTKDLQQQQQKETRPTMPDVVNVIPIVKHSVSPLIASLTKEYVARIPVVIKPHSNKSDKGKDAVGGPTKAAVCTTKESNVNAALNLNDNDSNTVSSKKKSPTKTPSDMNKNNNDGMDPIATLLTDTFSNNRHSEGTGSSTSPWGVVVGLGTTKMITTNNRVMNGSRNEVQQPTSHKVSPMVISLIKEHTARTPVDKYILNNNNKGKAALTSDQCEKDIKPQSTINMTPQKKYSDARSEIGSNSSTSFMHTPNRSLTSSQLDKQSENSRKSKITDRWLVHSVTSNNDVSNNRMNQTNSSDNKKVTDRWTKSQQQQQHGIAASEPGSSKFDSTTVAELLKIHAGNTPAGKVRSFRETTKSTLTAQINDNKKENDSTVVTAIPIRPNKIVVDRWLHDSSNLKKIPTNGCSHDDATTNDNNKVLSSKGTEQYKSQSDNHAVVQHDQIAGTIEIPTENVGKNSTLDPSLTASTGYVRDLWKSRQHANTKENNKATATSHSKSENIPSRTDGITIYSCNPISDDSTETNEGEVVHETVASEVVKKRSPDFDVVGQKEAGLSLVNSDFSVTAGNFNTNENDGIKEIDAINSDHLSKLSSTSHTNAHVESDFAKSSAFVSRNNQDGVMQGGILESITFSPLNSLNYESFSCKQVPVVDETATTTPMQSSASSNSDKIKTSDGASNLIERVEPSESKTRPTRDPEGRISSGAIGVSSSTKKIASDRASNKKRLQQYRGKAKEGAASRVVEASTANTLENTTHNHTPNLQKDSYEYFERNTASYREILPDAQIKSNFDLNALLQSGYETRRSTQVVSCLEYERDAMVVETIHSTASSTSSSPLASKAEKVLQNRRRRSSGGKTVPKSGYGVERSPKSESKKNTTDVYAPQVATIDQMEQSRIEKARLSSKYRTATRFIETDAASVNALETITYDSEGYDSSCNESGNTSGSNSRFFREDRNEDVMSSKRFKNPAVDSHEPFEDDKANLSSHSNWDTDWGGNTAICSLDFDKFVTVLDEQVAAIRDFVGGGTSSIPGKKAKQKFMA